MIIPRSRRIRRTLTRAAESIAAGLMIAAIILLPIIAS